jgi:23S rRNA pseudouridine2457 synthase
MPQILLFNKPFAVLSQFTSEPPHRVLAEYINHSGFYPAGRLDKDSEGLLILTDDGKLQQKISNPRYGKFKTYLVQVEGQLTERALEALRHGVALKDGPTRPAKANLIDKPQIWNRDPPIRERRMTAATGFPTLRLIRTKIDEWELGELQPGESKLLEV